VAAVVVVVVLSAFVDRSTTSATTSGAKAAASVSATAMPLSAPAAALSSSWFCAGAVGTPAHLADGSLVVANAGSRALTGTVTFVPSSGASTTRPLAVGAAQSVTIVEPAVADSAYLGAVVNLDGGQAAVQQVISGGEGTSSTACSTSGGTSWYFPAGTTQPSSTLSLLLLNPFPDDAIADLSFVTEQGQEDPQDFQGLVIPGGTLLGVDLGGHLRDRASVATMVHLRVGRVAAFETEAVQPQTSAQQSAAAPGTTAWPPGVDVVLGTPSPGTAWWWPNGVDTANQAEEYVLYNPNANPAQVSLGVVLDQGSADPFQITVEPQSVSVINSNTESRIPIGIGHAAWLRSTNGVGVVAARVTMAASAAAHPGIAEVLGSRLEASRWLIPGAGISGASPALVVYNPGTSPVTVAVTSLDGSPVGAPGATTSTSTSTSTSTTSTTSPTSTTPGSSTTAPGSSTTGSTTSSTTRPHNGAGSGGGAGQGQVVVPAGHRYVLSPSSTNPILVSVVGSGRVVVEGDTGASHGVGLDWSLGVPLGE
jgi:hypothetical protein